MSTVRPRRSVLYMPGSNARALDKARSLPADALILDLEDAVSPDSKDVARAQIGDALKAGGYGFRELIVRTNGLETPWGVDDLKALAPLGPDAILLPKVEDPATILKAEALLNEVGAPAKTTIWAMMETPLGILRAAEIAAASKRLTCFRHGHFGPDQGSAFAPYADAPAHAHLARHHHAGGAGLWPDHSRWRLSRPEGRGRLSRLLPAGCRAGLRRQDPDPSEPGRGRQ